MQRQRRQDPYPWTWEPAALVGAVVLLGVVVGVQVGRPLANLVAGAGWTWPESGPGDRSGPGPSISSPVGVAFWRSLSGVVAGDAGDGLAKPVPDRLAGPGLVWGSVATTEIVILTALIWLGVSVYLRWGPGRMRGMATRSEAEAILGVTRIRKVGELVRPDLYGKHLRRRTSHEGAPHASISVRRRAADPPWAPAYRAQEQHELDQDRVNQDGLDRRGRYRGELHPNLESDLPIGHGLNPDFLPRRRSRGRRARGQR